jgi:ATP-binding cassette subfamily B protein
MENYLKSPYNDFIKKNPNDLMKNITTEANLLANVVQNFLMMVSEISVVFFIYSVMLIVNLQITLFVSLFMLINVILIKMIILNKTKRWGFERSKAIQEYYQIIGATFGNFKFIKILSRNDGILNRFKDSCKKYIAVDIKFLATQPIPRLVLEFLGFAVVISLIIFSILRFDESGFTKIMPVISVFFIGMYRILPSINRIISYYQVILFYKGSFDIVVHELNQEVENLGDSVLEFHDNIKLQNVCFGFDKTTNVLKNINLQFKKGEKIAFVGESGSGKTTLVDLIIGLYQPKMGTIYVDGNKLSSENLKRWKQGIGYIPQDIYLFDGTIAENIVFNRKYEEKRIISVLKKAKIWEFLQTKDGIKTKVGDRGVILSGGQKQRIAIARALYDDPKILVLDEATSALDASTEEEIMREIYDISRTYTLIIVAHRVTTLKKCDKIFVIKDGLIDKTVFNVADL